MAGVTRNQKTSRTTHKNANASKKTVEKTFEKLETPEFGDSCTSRLSSKNETSVSKVSEKKMSPTRQTINMFEELANQFILDVKPFAESVEAPEGTTVLRSVLAPDVASGITDHEGSVALGDAEGSIRTESNFVSSQIEALAKMVADVDESGELHATNVTNEASEACDATLEDVQEDAVQDSGKVTIEDLKAKIIEILSVPFPSESPDEETRQRDINKIHDENMKKLKKKLRLDSEENRSVVELSPENCIQDKIGQFEVEISKHCKGTVKETSIRKVSCSSSKSCVIPKSEMDDVKKIFGSSRPSKRKKSLIQCNINDFTGESTFNVNFGSNTPQLLESEYSPRLLAAQDLAFEDYNAERELIEMARREKEVHNNDKIKITYIEDRQTKTASRLRSIFSRLFSCGTSI